MTSGTLFLTEENCSAKSCERFPQVAVAERLTKSCDVSWDHSVSLWWISVLTKPKQLPFPGDECPMMGFPGHLPTHSPMHKHVFTHITSLKHTLGICTNSSCTCWTHENFRACKFGQKSLKPVGVTTYHSSNTHATIIWCCNKGHTGPDKPCMLA